MSEDQFENRATFTKSSWGIRDYSLSNKGFCVAPSGLPVLYDTIDLAEAELLRLTEDNDRWNQGAPPHAKQSLNVGVVEVFVTFIEKPKE